MGVHYNPIIEPFTGKGKFILVDRDGVITKERPDYVKSVAELIFIEEALLGLELLEKAGFRVVILTNQSAVSRGIIGEKELREIHEVLFEEVKKSGGRIDRIYFCPHKPEDGCSCRKPKPGLFLKAKEDMGINLNETYYVGDKEIDMVAARAVGCKTAFVGKLTELLTKPDIVAENLYKVVLQILGIKR